MTSKTSSWRTIQRCVPRASAALANHASRSRRCNAASKTDNDCRVSGCDSQSRPNSTLYAFVQQTVHQFIERYQNARRIRWEQRAALLVTNRYGVVECSSDLQNELRPSHRLCDSVYFGTGNFSDRLLTRPESVPASPDDRERVKISTTSASVSPARMVVKRRPDRSTISTDSFDSVNSCCCSSVRIIWIMKASTCRNSNMVPPL